jgi:hypothetical protein
MVSSSKAAVAGTTPMTLAVNPAFLQEIKDCNPDLCDTIHQLRQVCDSDEAPAWISRQLTRLLDGLRDQLALQFSLEESYGYVIVPDHACQQLGALAARTQSQHGPLYLRLTELAEQAEDLQYRGVETAALRRLLERVRLFDAELSEHERTESELIERSFDRS